MAARTMRVLGIVGSPRRAGNTDVLVGQVLAGAERAGAQVDRIYLDESAVRPCRACEACAPTGHCVQEDDFQALLARMTSADGLVLGSPVYCGTVTAQMKALVDRADASQVTMQTAPDGQIRFVSRWPPGRRGVVVVAADYGPPEALRHTAGVLALLLKDLNVQVVGRVLARGLSGKGAALRDGALLEQAFVLGQDLVQG